MSPQNRIEAYFEACGTGQICEIAAHFSDDAVIYDTNIKPARGAQTIAAMWVKVRERWQGARWTVDSCIAEGDVAAIEWSMAGSDPSTGQGFVFRGSEHYRFVGPDRHIAEIRQYWTFNPDQLDTGLIGYNYHNA